MAVLAVVTSSPPGVEGGHLVIARSLVAAAREAGHDAHLIVTPDYGYGQFARSYLGNWRTNVEKEVGRPVDQVISLRYPSYAVRHPHQVCWLNHTIREFYDLWPRFSKMLSPRARVKESVRRAIIHATDTWLLNKRVSKVVAQSQTIARRLASDFRIDASVVYPPPPPRPYRCDSYDDYIFTASRLTPLKRVDLLIHALAERTARRVRAVIAGEGECRPALEDLARQLGVANRVTFLGRVSEDTLIDHYSRCRAVFFGPSDEDYGFVTAEAFASGKAVVTCHDSGGPSELVADGVTGIICDPDAGSIAIGLARLVDDRPFAEQLGRNALTRAAAMSWQDAVTRLLIV